MSDIQLIPVADLLFDVQNPRLVSPNGGQRDTLRAIAEQQDGKLRVLAEDILQHGVDPSALSIVVKQRDGRYVVLEGNRRLAAIRSLENPESVADVLSASVLKRMRQLSTQYQGAPLDEIPCLVVKDRDAARHWIELRHMGEMGGAGLTPWRSNEIARFRARGGGQSEIDTQALDFLEARGDITAERRSAVAGTTLRRMLSNPSIRANTGLGYSQKTLHVLGNEAATAKALLWLVNQIADGKVKVGDVYTSEKREEFAKAMPKSILASSSPRSGATPTSKPARATRPKVAATPPAPRDRLIPRDCVLNVTELRLAKIEEELRGLSLANFTNAVSVLFRVFVELSADAYVVREGLNTSIDARLNQKLLDVTSDLVAKKQLTHQSAAPARKMAQKDSLLGTTTTLMNNWVHNQHMFPAAAELRTGWDNMQPWFTAVWPA